MFWVISSYTLCLILRELALFSQPEDIVPFTIKRVLQLGMVIPYLVAVSTLLRGINKNILSALIM